MSLSSRARLIALIATMSCLAVMIVWAAGTSWREVSEVRNQFGRIETASGRNDIGHLRALVFSTTATLFTFEVTDRPEDRAKLDERYQELGAWMDSTKATLLTDEERAIFEEISVAHARYIAETKELANANPLDETKEVMVSRFAQIEGASERLLALAAKLADLRRETFGNFFRETEKSVTLLQKMIFASLLFLVILIAWGVRATYRDTIAPLRLKLIETREIAERREKLASLGVLAAGVAHEIRNPLTAIKARLFTQKKALAAGSPAFIDGEFIANEISRLERIVRDFLSFARPGASQRDAVSTSELLDHVGELLAPQLQEKEIALTVEPGPGMQIEGDAQQLEQVLINLVQNAADSIGEKGQITLRARADKIALSENIRRVVILEVEDNGKGIPTEVQQRLFDPFFSTKSSGTGLGLSIAARIVEQHGGALQYQTQVNRGTTFGIILPAKTES